MKIHVVAETFIKGNGVYTAFIDHLNLLRSQDDVEVLVNEGGRGDVFHAHTYGLYYFLKGLPYKGRRVFTVHVTPASAQGSIPSWNWLKPVVTWYLKQVYAFADVCIAISPEVEQAIKALGVSTEVVRIYNPIDLDTWSRTPEKRRQGRAMLGLSDNEQLVLGVGQLQARKGVEDFIDVAAAMPETRFVWVGGRPMKLATEGIQRIDGRMAEATSNIQFTGMLDLERMPLMYAAADLMLFPSYQENCPLAPVEAAASGLPVVFRDLAEYRSLYEHPYLHADSTASFVEQTTRLLTDTDYYQTALLQSSKLVEQFDKAVIRKQLISVYNELENKHDQKRLGLRPLWVRA